MAAIAGGLAAGVGGSVVGGLMQSSENKKFRAQMQAQIGAAMQELDAVGMPPDLSAKLIYEELKQQGTLTPELEKEINLQHSEMANLKERSEGRETQIDALNKLRGITEQGLSPQDMAALNKTRQMVGKDTEAKRQQILQQAAARGQSGSGYELMAQLNAAQAGADQMSQGGDELAALRSQARIEALAKLGSAGSQLRSQDTAFDTDKAKSEDIISQWNTSNSREVQARNVAAQNQAQAANLASKQQISNQNAGLYNAELLRQKQEQGALWDREMQRAQSRANARLGAAGQTMQMGAPQSVLGTIIGGLGQAVPAAIGAYNQSKLSSSQAGYYDRAGSPAIKSNATPANVGSVEEQENYYANLGKPT